jgi:DNA-binding XRE family transcriptional regulator
MPYHPKVVEHVKKLPMTNMGAALGRWAIYFDLPVMKLAVAIGVTRQSVYNWMKGGEIFPVFKPRVQTLIKIMEHAHANRKSSEDVWRSVCREFDLKA